MRCRHLAWAALGALALGAVTAPVCAEQPYATSSPDSCVVLHERLNKDSQTMDFTLESGCKAVFACTMSWVVTCDHAQTRGSGTTTLASESSATFTASAATCKGDWEVRDPAWSCKAAP
jgi:hypothetical protein